MRILCVYAHPDDESFGPAAVLAKAARAGAQIYGLFATRGEHGQPTAVPAPDPQEMGRLREADLREATRLIGFRQIDFLGYEDGSVADVPEGLLKEHVLDAVLAYRPDVMLTFGPGGITKHADHVAMYRAATAAFHHAREMGMSPQALFYDAVPPERAQEMELADLPDGQPNTWVDVRETFDVKLEALRCHARHVLDAQERVAALEAMAADATARSPLHRAWPPVPGGRVLVGLDDDLLLR